MADNDKQTEVAQPGQVVAPGNTDVPQPQAPLSTPQAPQQTPPVQPPQPDPLPPQAVNQPEADQPFSEQEVPAPAASIEPVSWTASEFVVHEKNAGWYVVLLAITFISSALVYLITKDKTSTAVVVVCAFALGLLANRKPRQLQYALSPSGITIGSKHFDYTSFKSFSIVPEGGISSVVFTPLKRFAPPTTMYYAPQDEDRILSILSSFLPMEEHKADVFDSVTQRIRF